MKFVVYAVLAIIFFPSLSRAEDITTGITSGGNNTCIGVCSGLSMTVSRCLEVSNALASLDPAPNDKTAPAIKLGAARITMALNATALRPVVEGVEKTRLEMLRSASDRAGHEITANSPEGREFAEKFQEVLDHPCPVTLARLRYEDLHLDTNEIPIQTLTSLGPMLDK